VAAWFLPETFHKDLNLLEGATSPDDHGPTPVPTP